jgi:hypothetical protein
LEKGGRPWWSAAAVLLLVLQPVLFFWRTLVNPRTHIPFDLEGFHLPLLAYVAQCARNGVAPLWDPFPYNGVPIHADPQAQIFYPPTWLALVAGNLTQGHKLFFWVEALIPLHMALGGVFCFWLLRRVGVGRPAAFLGASVYGMGPFFASQTQHLGAICCAAWLPLMVLAAFEMRLGIRARWIGVLALAAAMTVLAGFMPATIVAWIALALVMLAWMALGEASWRTCAGVAVGLALSLLICTVELLPLWQLTHESIASMRGRVFGAGGGLPWESLVSLVVPDFYHIFEPATSYKLPYNFTFLYTYCGLATAVLLAAALLMGRSRERAFLALTVVCAIWMLGEHTPIYRGIYAHVADLLRGALYSEYALMAFSFCAAVTAALMFDRLGARLPAAALWVLALATSYDLIRAGANRPMNNASGSYKEAGSENGAWKPYLIAELRERMSETDPPERVDYLDDAMEPAITTSELLRLPTANGSNPFLLRRMHELRVLFSSGEWWQRRRHVNRPDSTLLRLLNIRWLLSGSRLAPDEIRAAGLEESGPVEGVFLYRNTRALPRFFLVRRARRSPDEPTTFRQLAAENFEPAEEAFVEGLPGDWLGGENGGELPAVAVKAYTPNRIHLSAVTTTPAFLVTSEPMYPGWEANVNGKPVPLRMTNGAFRGLALPSGTNEIVMQYHPPHLCLYLVVSTAFLLLASGLALFGTLGFFPQR